MEKQLNIDAINRFDSEIKFKLTQLKIDYIKGVAKICNEMEIDPYDIFDIFDSYNVSERISSKLALLYCVQVSDQYPENALNYALDFLLNEYKNVFDFEMTNCACEEEEQKSQSPV